MTYYNLSNSICIIANEISNVTFSVILACPESFFKHAPACSKRGKDSRQAGMTILKGYVNLLIAFVLVGKVK